MRSQRGFTLVEVMVALATRDASIEAAMQEAGEREVESQLIGKLVMQRLRELDPVAYVRFASVYRRFEDVEAFVKELHQLK